jgi:hypothetical protein
MILPLQSHAGREATVKCQPRAQCSRRFVCLAVTRIQSAYFVNVSFDQILSRLSIKGRGALPSPCWTEGYRTIAIYR